MNKNSILCNYIKNHKNWREELSSAPFFIKISEDDNLAIFNYSTVKIFNKSKELKTENIENDQKNENLFLDFSIPEVQEARGIIINTDTLDVVCWPFRKFGNYGESYIDDIDWSSAAVQEKVDGSIMKLWYDKREGHNEWRISSNSVITPDNKTLLQNRSFIDIFNIAAKNQNLDLNKLNKDNTYIFELVSPYNKVIIRYKDTEIYHIGTRNNITGEELNEDIGIKKPKLYNISSLDECLKKADELNNGDIIDNEGFVVVDKNWNRIKIKSPEYVRMHYEYNNGILSKEKIINMISNKDDEEFLTYFPEFKEAFDEIRTNIKKISDYIECYCVKLKEFVDKTNIDRKSFSLKFGKDNLFLYAIRYCYKDIKLEDVAFDMRMKHLISLINTIDKYDFNKSNPGYYKEFVDKDIER